MIPPLREPINDLPEPMDVDSAPGVSRTTGDLQWSLPMTALGLLLVLTAVPLVAGQRGIGISGNTSPFKGYSGLRVQPDAKRMAYYHEQTIAVVEVGHARELYNCELIEVYKSGELKMALRNLTSFAKPYRLTFEEMVELMTLCDQLSSPFTPSAERSGSGARAIPNINPVTLLSGIMPGTKWCGAGDLANNYFDLGAEANVDKCCRAHDLCPVKVRAYTSRYNLTNNSVYSKSHCTCDDLLLQCLKSSHNPLADIMGNIYFNLLKVPCVRQGKERSKFQPAKRYDSSFIRI